ncbi:hypothetical protein JAAARDRAFT_122146, partial [Jaapia argillacea MUCL 33604]
RVPLTIISGFLGAGKSTLIRRILTERHGYRIAVIMNEFGDTADIEAKTINVTSPDNPAEGSEEFLELANGCLCCSIKDSGVAAIEKLMQRKGAFDYILLETTGLADPGPIASIFWHNEEFSMGAGRDIHLDGVVCVVDAVFGRKASIYLWSADSSDDANGQIASSDVILLNKTDLVPESDLISTEEVLRQVNPAATIHRTVRGQIDLAHIIGIDAFSSRPLPGDSHRQESCQEDHDHSTHPHVDTINHYEIRGISSLQVTCPVLTDTALERLDEWIRTILWENRLVNDDRTTEGLEVLRCKGMFSKNSGERYVLQGVKHLYDIQEVKGSEDMGVPDVGKLVLIGKGLGEVVRRSLERLFVAQVDDIGQ